MMREEVGPAAVGVFGATGAALAQYGTSWLAISLALVGAVLAAREVDPFRWREFAAVLAFNAVVGVIGGAILAAWIMARGWSDHPLLLSGVSFAVGYLGNDALAVMRPAATAALIRFLGGAKK